MKHIFKFVLMVVLFFATNVANAQAAMQNFVPVNFGGTIAAAQTSENIARTLNKQNVSLQQNKDNGSIYNFKNDENSSSSSNNPFILSKKTYNDIISCLYSDKYLSENARVSFSYLLFQIQPNAP